MTSVGNGPALWLTLSEGMSCFIRRSARKEQVADQMRSFFSYRDSLMTQLPDNQRLDDLLYKVRANKCLLTYYGELLVEKVVSMHKRLLLPKPQGTDSIWGDGEQLDEKLSGNLQFLKEALDRRGGLSREYGSWFEEQTERIPRLLTATYFPYFNDRLQCGYIRQCHGDLKAPNIWIAPRHDKDSGEVRDRVLLLDAIDFNPAFANIDVLSDIAMLVVDIQVRMGTEYLADSMIKNYLTSTGQQDAKAMLVLNYYLFEKAIVGAAVSVIDDQLENFSRAYLKVAKKYAACFACAANQLTSESNQPAREGNELVSSVRQRAFLFKRDDTFKCEKAPD